MTRHDESMLRPTRAALIGLLIAIGLAMVFALGPLAGRSRSRSAQVGNACGLPDAWMLLGRRPMGRLRLWCVALIVASLGAGVAAQGAHAVWYDELSHRLTLPWGARLLVATRQEEDSMSVEAVVLDILRSNPLANWKVVRESTGLTESNAKRALTAARKELSHRSTPTWHYAAGASCHLRSNSAGDR